MLKLCERLLFERFPNAFRTLCECYANSMPFRTLCESYANSMRTLYEIFANSMRTLCECYANSMRTLCERFDGYANSMLMLFERYAKACDAMRTLCERFAMLGVRYANALRDAIQTVCERFASAIQKLCVRYANADIANSEGATKSPHTVRSVRNRLEIAIQPLRDDPEIESASKSLCDPLHSLVSRYNCSQLLFINVHRFVSLPLLNRL
jgi:CII-binding regulator of phage lambda lysogenization HflD